MTETSGEELWTRARPEVNQSVVSALVRDSFGVSGTYSEVGSQQDRNFIVTNPNGSGALVKVNHPAVFIEAVAFQGAVSDWLNERGISTPTMLRTSSGQRSIPLALDPETTAHISAFELVEGSTLAESADLDGALCAELGSLAGRCVEALGQFEHEHIEQNLQWDLTNSLAVVKRLVGDLREDDRDLCLRIAGEAHARLVSLQELPRQVIHGDLTSDNIMRDRQGDNWIIDLGDAARSWRVAELSILLADVIGRTADMALVSRATRGFADHVDLSDDEIDAIWPLVVLRGAVLAVSGWSQLRIDPTNAYAQERTSHEWKVFQRASSYDYDDVAANLRLACGRPHRRGLAYGPLVDGISNASIVDLGITSPSLDRGAWISPDAETRLVRTALSGSSVACTRFGESRLTRVSPDVTAVNATKSRIVELAAAAETPVLAPFSGRIIEGNSFVELSDLGVTVRVEGILPNVSLIGRSTITQGTRIGTIAPGDAGFGTVTISRRMFSAQAVPPFGLPGEEYESEGAADPSSILGLDASPDPIAILRSERRRRENAMGGAAERYYAEPPQMERGWNTLLIDTEGRAYLDMVNNVSAIGHSHPRLGDAVGRQLHLLNTNSRFLYDAYRKFTDNLLAFSPDPSLDTVIPVNSGSEAVDLAMKIAHVATGRKDVIATREAYHGWTMAADAVSTSAFDNPSASTSRPEWVHLVDAPNPYRGRHRGANAGAAYAAEVAQLARSLASADRAPAAFISEPVLGNAGGVIPPEGYLPSVYQAVRAHGGLAIADEIQVGYGRLGRSFWGSTMQGALPDIIVVAKAAGNAFPLGAVITRRELVDSLREEGMFFSSAAGAPASAIAGATVLDVIHDEGLQQRALRTGEYLSNLVRGLRQRHPIIGTVHGSGLYQGIELVKDHVTLEPATEETAWVCEQLLPRGIIMQPASERQNVLKVKPPLTLSEFEVDVFIAALNDVLTELPQRR